MNGKSIEIDNTDAEGRLILAGIYLTLSRSVCVLMPDYQMLSTTHHRPSTLIHWWMLLLLLGWHISISISILHLLAYCRAMEAGLGNVYSGVFAVSPSLARAVVSFSFIYSELF